MDQGIDFSSAKLHEELHGYIPQAKVEGFVYPLLACDVTEIDDDIISWKDPNGGYVPHSLVEDVKNITGCTSTHPVFSIVKQWKTKPRERLSSDHPYSPIELAEGGNRVSSKATGHFIRCDEPQHSVIL